MTLLEKVEYILKLDRLGIIPRNNSYDKSIFAVIDDVIVVIEAIYAPDKNILGKSFEERFLILTKVLGIKSDINFYLNNGNKNDSEFLTDEEFLYFVIRDKLLKEVHSNGYPIDFVSWQFMKRLMTFKG